MDSAGGAQIGNPVHATAGRAKAARIGTLVSLFFAVSAINAAPGLHSRSADRRSNRKELKEHIAEERRSG